MRINTEDSIKQAREVHDKYGSWADARKALRKDGAPACKDDKGANR